MGYLKRFKLGIIGTFIFLIFLVLFNLSPFSEINFMKCIYQQNVSNPIGAQMQPFCGYLLGDAPFPFKSRSTDYANFCKQNKKVIEEACNLKVNTTLLESSNGKEYECIYFVHDFRDIISIERYPEPPNSEYISTYRLNIIPLKPYVASFYASFDYEKECKNLTQSLLVANS